MSSSSHPSDDRLGGSSNTPYGPHTVHAEFGYGATGSQWTIEVHGCSKITQSFILNGLFINLSEIKTAWKDAELNEADWADIEELVELVNDQVYADQDGFVAQIDAARKREGVIGSPPSGQDAMDAFVESYERQFHISRDAV
jgi:hypothetical protein